MRPVLRPRGASRRPSPRSRLAAVVLLLLVCAPGAADVLVTRDGAQVVTRGAWRVEGRLVVFRLEDGSLGSMRLSEIDLDASREATEAASRPPAEPAAEPERATVAVITDRDVRRATPEPVEEAATDDAGTGALLVTEWQQEDLPDGEGTVLVGRVENPGPDALGRIRIVADLYNDQGASFASHEAQVDNPTLMPGQGTRFRVVLRDLFAFTGVRFTTTGLPLVVTVPEEDGGEPPFDDGGSGEP